MATSKLVKVSFATSNPLVRYRYEDGAWQDSNIFLVTSGLDSYTFHAEDARDCKSSITLSEGEIDFPLGNGVITIQKEITGSTAADEDVMFQFKLVHESITINNLLVSVNTPRTITGLPNGSFTITESPPPTGYLHSNVPVVVSLSDGDLIKSVVFTNEIDGDPVPTGDGTITINKRMIIEEPTDLAVVFTANLIGPIVKYGIEFSINTPAVIENLPDGTYELQEIGLPEGYNFHGISPGAVVIAGSGSHEFDVLNSSGDFFVGDGSITIEKRIFDEADVEVLDSDVLFNGYIRVDTLEIPGLKFSVNTPLVLINLPFKEYKLFEGDAVVDYQLQHIVPWPITLSEVGPSGTFLVTNLFEDVLPVFRSDLLYGVDRRSNSDINVRKIEKIAGVWQHTASFDIFAAGGKAGNFASGTHHLAVLRNGDVLVIGSGGAAFSGDGHELDQGWLLDKDLNVKKYLERTNADDTTSNVPTIWIDEKDNIYWAFDKPGVGKIVQKYMPDFETLIMETEVGSGRNLIGGGVTSRYIFMVNVNLSGPYSVNVFDRNTGALLETFTRAEIQGTSVAIINLPNRGFILHSGNSVSLQGIAVEYNEYRGIVSETTLAEYNVRLSSGGSNNDGTYFVVAGNVISLRDKDGSEIFSLDNSDLGEWVSNQGAAKLGWTEDPNKVFFMTDRADSSAGVLAEINISSQSAIFMVNMSVLLDLRGPQAWGMIAENWQLRPPTTPPTPPPGTDTTVQVNKIVTDGIAADDDVYFDITISVDLGYQFFTYTGQVSVNDPFILNDAIAGEYRVTELFNPNFEIVSITPETFTLGAGGSQVVGITNKKLGTPAESGRIYITKRILNAISSDDTLIFDVDVINNATGLIMASFTLRQNITGGGHFLPGNYTIVETNSHTGIDHVSIIPNPVTVVADEDYFVEVTNERTAISVSAQLTVEQVFDTVNPSAAASKEYLIERTSNWPPGTFDGKQLEVRELADPNKIVLIEYSASDSVNDIAVKVMNSMTGFQAVTGYTVPVTVTNPSAGVFRITARAAGSAGNSACFRFTYNHHIVINNKTSGQFDDCLTGGADGDLRSLTVQYPYSVEANTPIVTVVWAGGDTPAIVAGKIADEINADGSIQLTASAAGNVVTFSEKRIGAEHAGKQIRVAYNSNTIDITPDSGILVMG